ncbi:hypothetical protein EYF80_013034 [Liparis tanakae]|uniref:Uncharacterized protein n=1 Tax=Liparis tanakae TaxID=230148 RepID=A0A4Z2IGJ2_9TELE|nr:hypothetical protein EYF80_013034 [Liparis tanakae]
MFRYPTRASKKATRIRALRVSRIGAMSTRCPLKQKRPFLFGGESVRQRNPQRCELIRTDLECNIKALTKLGAEAGFSKTCGSILFRSSQYFNYLDLIKAPFKRVTPFINLKSTIRLSTVAKVATTALERSPVIPAWTEATLRRLASCIFSALHRDKREKGVTFETPLVRQRGETEEERRKRQGGEEGRRGGGEEGFGLFKHTKPVHPGLETEKPGSKSISQAVSGPVHFHNNTFESRSILYISSISTSIHLRH